MLRLLHQHCRIFNFIDLYYALKQRSHMQLAVQNLNYHSRREFLSQAHSYCHVHCHSQPGLSNEWSVSAGGLIQQTNKEVTVWWFSSLVWIKRFVLFFCLSFSYEPCISIQFHCTVVLYVWNLIASIYVSMHTCTYAIQLAIVEPLTYFAE